MSKLVITETEIAQTLCTVCAVSEDNKIIELRIDPKEDGGLLGNIYMGQVEKVSENIQAAFVRLCDGQTGYLPLKEAEYAIYSSGCRKGNKLRPGDELLVQVSRDAMKMKLPALTTNLNLPGKYLVLTTGNRQFGYSKKLTSEESELLHGWLEEEQNRVDRPYGVIVRTNAAEAQKQEILGELDYLKAQYMRVAVNGTYRTCGSLICSAVPPYISAVRDAYDQVTEEIVTDIPEYFERIRDYFQEVSPDSAGKVRLYEDKLLPLIKLYRVETALSEVRQKKVWLNSGGFLVIEPTEAFVSIDVNSGKYSSKKNAEETYRKINLDAAKEIARQIRLRNFSGIILIDFINMENADHRDELFHVLQKYLRKDPIRAKAVDITQLQILEVTRKKVRRPIYEILNELNLSPKPENDTID